MPPATTSASRSRRPAVDPREWLVAGAGALTLAFAAWGLGGIPARCLHVLLGGGLLTLLLALIPLPFCAPARASWGRLLRWPAFWMSLAFLLYLVIAASNPSAEWTREPRGWYVDGLMDLRNAPWPSSVRSDYEPMNAWRVINGFLGAFALIWGLWAGLSRRLPVLIVLWAFLLSGAGMAFAAILQQLSGAEAVLWTYQSSNPNFWGSFFYRNQGVAFLNLVLVAGGVLFFYHARKANQRARTGGPHLLCFVLFAAVATSVGLALSRGGIIFASILSIAFVALAALTLLRATGQQGSLWMTLLPVALLACGSFVLVINIDVDAIEERFGDIEATLENADRDARALSTRATWDMAQDRLWLGWGPGAFRYVFPEYQKHYPAIFYQRYHRRNEQWVGRKLYRYAHNDLVQFLAEYGVVGVSLLGLTLLSWIFSLLRSLPQAPAAFGFLLLGIVCTLAHAFFDFILNSPAVWFAFVGVIVAVTKLASLETRARRGAG